MGITAPARSVVVCLRKLMSNHVGQRRSDANSTVNHKNQLHVRHDGSDFSRPIQR